MNCENCCEAFVGTYEGYYVSKDDKKMRVCSCCKNEYIMMGWIGIKVEEPDDDEGSTTNEEESMCVCKGCGQNIEENGFCSEGCRFGEFAGVWTCDCGEKCKDVEFCPKCGPDGDEGSTTNEYMEEDMGECPKCDCAVKRKDLAWRIGYYLDICAKCDDDE